VRAVDPRIVFVGVHREAALPLRFLVDSGARLVGLVTMRETSMERVSGAVDLAPIVAPRSVPVLRVRNVNHAKCASWIADRQPDLILVVGWTQLLKEPLLRLPKVACLGFHASLLPRYRGRAPINWALIHDERRTGNTMIVLAPGADEGDIVAQRSFEITDRDDCATLYDKVAESEVDMLRWFLDRLPSGEVVPRPQDDSEATVMPKRTPEDGEIDWSWEARRVFNWVRAQTHPYPGAFTWSDGRKVWIWRARTWEPVEAVRPAAARPHGSVRILEDGRPIVRSGSGWVEVISVQRDGEPELAGVEAAARWLTEEVRFQRREVAS
jgi:methionyl-tRNA formyltransferase